MQDSDHHPQTNRETPRRTHERSDASFRGVMVFLAVIAVSAVIIHAVLWWWLRGMSKEPPTGVDAAEPWMIAPQGTPESARNLPELQISPPRDWQAYLASQEQELRSYGWADAAAGRARIPIEQAMQVVVEKGLPHWGPTNRPPRSPLDMRQERARDLQQKITK